MVSSSNTTILNYKMVSSFDLFVSAGTVAVYWFSAKMTLSMRTLFSYDFIPMVLSFYENTF
jgi:hypothetical protein